MSRLLFLENGDGTILIHRNQASSLQLLDHLVCIVVISTEIFYLSNLGLKGLDSGDLGLDSSFIRSFLDFGIQDLLLRASADVAHLEHVDAAALHDYHKKELEAGHGGTYGIRP